MGPYCQQRRSYQIYHIKRCGYSQQLQSRQPKCDITCADGTYGNDCRQNCSNNGCKTYYRSWKKQDTLNILGSVVPKSF